MRIAARTSGRERRWGMRGWCGQADRSTKGGERGTFSKFHLWFVGVWAPRFLYYQSFEDCEVIFRYIQFDALL